VIGSLSSTVVFFSLNAKTNNSSCSGVNPDEAVFTSKPSSLARKTISADATSNSLAI
jgi:hypothetical protein